jgi:hypothetical protein
MLTLSSPEPHPVVADRPLAEADAVDIWIARWLHVRRKDILARYGCDPRRLYDIWEGKRFPSSRAKALDKFAKLYPDLDGRVDTSHHRRIPRPGPAEGQAMLFERLPIGRNGRR